jgi:AraC-like DNA-binding protein
MSEVSFSRFIKKRTGKTFVESLNEIRLGHASRSLINTSNTISEIAYKCGFNNLSYFNRIFKAKNGCTPKEFRDNYSGTRTFV